MAVTPNTRIRLLKSPIELDNLNQLTFANKEAQTNYFLSLPHIEIDNCTYQRKDDIIRFPAHIDTLLEYNYVMYQNTNYTNKWFYIIVCLISAIGIAIMINMGTNVIFESVSDMTFSIAAVFQLVLSIDYSIMLMHRFEQEYELLGKTDREKALSNAIVNAFGSISSSSITTIVGLLVLLLMTFTIGKDIGLVISKGVFFSLVCVFTVMPSLIMWFYDLLCKLNKENLKKQMQLRKAGENND